MGSRSTPHQSLEVFSQSRAAVGVADYDSVEQLSIDISIMPGASISNVEVIPIEEVGGVAQFPAASAMAGLEWLH